jgi:pterin-4a-carbinolamine dehydratase
MIRDYLIVPKDNPANIAVMTSKWMKVSDENRNQELTKEYSFLNVDTRNVFVFRLLGYEKKITHHGIVEIKEKTVSIRVSTKNVDIVTELDYEYARFCDNLYKDVTYNTSCNE